MNIAVDWQKPILLARLKKLCFTNSAFPEVEPRSGVYFFSRQVGTTYEPFYVGESRDLHARLLQQLDKARIMMVLLGLDANFKRGARYFHYGYMVGSKTEKRRHVVQKFLIERALAENLPLLNTQLTNVPTHTLTFDGNKSARAIYGKRSVVRA